MSAAPATGARPRRILVFLPLAIFSLVAGAFIAALYSGDPSKLPSALLGKPAPEISLPPIESLAADGAAIPGFSRADLTRGEVTVVNVWASWCAPCVIEHPLLMRLRQSGVRIMGVNYKDRPAAARAFIARYGNPFTAIGADADGKAGIDWGVYKVPETFVVNGAGLIVYKLVGGIDETNLASQLLPAIEAARKSR